MKSLSALTLSALLSLGGCATSQQDGEGFNVKEQVARAYAERQSLTMHGYVTDEITFDNGVHYQPEHRVLNFTRSETSTSYILKIVPEDKTLASIELSFKNNQINGSAELEGKVMENNCPATSPRGIYDPAFPDSSACDYGTLLETWIGIVNDRQDIFVPSILRTLTSEESIIASKRPPYRIISKGNMSDADVTHEFIVNEAFFVQRWKTSIHYKNGLPIDGKDELLSPATTVRTRHYLYD